MSHTMNRRGDKGAALGSTWSIFALLSISIIALFAVVAFSDAWRFCTFGRSSVITSKMVSNGKCSRYGGRSSRMRWHGTRSRCGGTKGVLAVTDSEEATFPMGSTAASVWKLAWEASRQGHRVIQVVDDTPPGPAVLKLYRGLSRRQCSILSQLRSGNIGLNAYLAQIRAVDSPLCLTCAIPETISHFLFPCCRSTAARHSFRMAVESALTLRNTNGDVKALTAVLDFVNATGRFEAYRPSLQ